jgi:hypothetical protein
MRLLAIISWNEGIAIVIKIAATLRVMNDSTRVNPAAWPGRVVGFPMMHSFAYP